MSGPASPGPFENLVSIRDFESAARETFDPHIDAYYAGGAGDERTLRGNEEAFDQFRLRPFIGLEEDVDLATTLLGSAVTMPLGIAPTAMHGLAHGDAEGGTARAASAAGVVYCASSMASMDIGDIASCATGPWWFQYYGGSDSTLARAAELGFEAAVLTADAAVPGHRDGEFRAYRRAPEHPFYEKGSGYQKPGAQLSRRTPRTLTWNIIDTMVATTEVPVIIKGVMTGEDAKRSVESGAAAVWISNHGGRQLDRAPATLDVLEEVVDAVGSAVEVYIDGGFRRGTEVVMALALGARAVFVGRPIIHGLAVAGEAGVAAVLEQYRREIANALALLSVSRPSEIGRRHIMRH